MPKDLQKIIVLGAGVIGAAIASRLARAGAAVTIIDAGLAGGGASGRSFGWINASFHADLDHFNLRVAGMQAWHRAETEMGKLPINWQGALWWEEQGKALHDMAQTLTQMGYDVDTLDQSELARRVPILGNPADHALFFPKEGAAETHALTLALLHDAQVHGAQHLSGVTAQSLVTESGTITGVGTAHGILTADNVVVACGNGSAQLLAPLGIELPMLSRPGLLMTTHPINAKLDHILVAPEGEIRQMPNGGLLIPTSASHQSDDTSAITTSPLAVATDALARVQAMMPSTALRLNGVSMAYRPVPGDGLPVIGDSRIAGLHLAVMHSGITLAAIAAELLSDEIIHQETNDLSAPYRLSRFTD
jgi:glycine/D-amino acid oxidase-like deaminating enzyme